jgi:hypothetical protein
MSRLGSWIELVGVGRVLVGTGVPGSRPRFVVERWRAGRGVESLFGGSKCAGRSIKRVLQPRQFHNGRSRAAHFTAKAMSVELCSGVSSSGLSGVWVVARAYSWVRNRRGPFAWPCRAKTRGISRW